MQSPQKTDWLRRTPWISVILIPLAVFLVFRDHGFLSPEVGFFVAGVGVLFFLTGLVSIYLHAIWYRLWLLSQRP